ncbi:MAG: Na/Pi-cotransporter family protein [Proteobacteria bacterium SG_bin7]|nr:MAG: Na/Pi-cotransporter family protein [Proteobacteria bacterium SG_bin7]
MVSDYLQKIVGNRVRELMGKISQNNFLSILVGIALTVCLQSSGAVTMLLIGLGSANVITLNQVMGVIIGSSIGTTVTVQLISYNVAQYGLPIFTLGFLGYFTAKKLIVKNWMGIVMGFGLIFFGLEYMGKGTEAINHISILKEIFVKLSKEPILTIVASMIFTAFIHSSAVTIGLAMTLTTQNVITLQDAIYWVYGANIGTTATGIMGAVGGNFIGRQVAWANFFYKFLSVGLLVPFTGIFVRFLDHIHDNMFRAIADAHTIYNILAAIAFYPLINVGASMFERLIQPAPHERKFGVKYLDRSNYQDSALAMAYARREILRMGDIVVNMIKDSINVLDHEDHEIMDNTKENDNKVDLLMREIKLYLVKYANEAVGGIDQVVFNLISVASDLEAAADVIDNNILELARKKNALKVDFSKEGWEEIKQFHAMTVEIATISMSCFEMQDPTLAQKLIDMKRRMRKKEKEFREHHIERLNKGLKQTINTSAIHLDLLADFRRVVGLFCNHAYDYLPEKRT